MLRLHRPLRPTANADPDDVLAAKRVFLDLGYYEPPTGDLHPWPDAPLFQAIRSFQVDNDLAPDAEMLPGGPTESALNALSAPEPNLYRQALAQGRVREQDAVSDSESWRQSLERRTGHKLTPAAVPLAILAAPPAAKSLLGIAGAVAAGAGLYGLQKWREGHAAGDPRIEVASPEKPAPPRDFDPEETRKLREAMRRPPEAPPVAPIEPEQLIPPVIDPAEWIEIFPDQSDELPPFIIIERKGSPPIRDYNDVHLNALGKAARLEGAEIEEFYGAHKNKELHLPGPHKGSTKDSSYMDFAVKLKEIDARILGNSQTMRKDGSPTGVEVKQEMKVMRNKSTGDVFVTVPKPAPGETLDFDALVEHYRLIVRELQGKASSMDRATPFRLKPRFRRD
jgi:hypothetical protein